MNLKELLNDVRENIIFGDSAFGFNSMIIKNSDLALIKDRLLETDQFKNVTNINFVNNFFAEDLDNNNSIIKCETFKYSEGIKFEGVVHLFYIEVNNILDGSDIVEESISIRGVFEKVICPSSGNHIKSFNSLEFDEKKQKFFPWFCIDKKNINGEINGIDIQVKSEFIPKEFKNKFEEKFDRNTSPFLLNDSGEYITKKDICDFLKECENER